LLSSIIIEQICVAYVVPVFVGVYREVALYSAR